ncbi:MAG: hypothetical protein GHCLOJNM_02582 [bacterium]|nr:hypothetical protein [bacterium]
MRTRRRSRKSDHDSAPTSRAAASKGPLTKQILVWVVFLWLVLCHTAGAKIIRVALDGSGENGETWETAYKTVSAGIAHSASGDAIWVKGGLYAEAVNLKSGVGIYGGFAGTEAEDQFSLRDWNAHTTTLYAGGTGRQVVRATDIVSAILDGFVLRKGTRGISLIDSEVSVFRCEVLENGPGIAIFEGSTVITGCTITQNINNLGGGGGIDVSGERPESSLRMVNCRVFGNVSRARGGGVYCSGSMSPVIDSCLITDNLVLHKPISGGGGGRFEEARGGGVYIRDAIVVARNCTIVRNQQGDFGPTRKISFFFEDSGLPGTPTAIIQSSIVADATASDFGDTPILDVSYSLFPSFVAGEGNISGNPKLAGLFTPKPYSLLPGSPCIDTATRASSDRDVIGNPRPLDVPGVGVDGPDAFDMGAYEYPGPFINSRSDINQSGKVDTEDLLLLIADWQKVSGP